MNARDPREGMVLINVLVLLALSATVVFLMISLTDVAIARSQRFSEASEVQALLHAGEISAVVALRRDMIEAPDMDNPLEAWGKAAQKRIDIKGGSFELRIVDARGLFNLNSLPEGGVQAVEALQAIFTVLDLPEDAVRRIADTIILDGPLRNLDDLTSRVGLSEADVTALSALVTALPGQGEININAVSLDLLSILLRNPSQARALISRRDRAGFLTPDDITAANAVLPAGLGFRSDLFRTHVTARIGATEQSITSLLQRRKGTGDAPEVAVVRRSSETAASPPPP